MTTCPLSKAAMNWLNMYLWKPGQPKMPSKKIVNEFKKYLPSEPILVFRGVRPHMMKNTECIVPRLKSYAHIEEQAIAVGGVVGEYINPGESLGVLERRIICPRNILVDTSLLPESCKDNIPPGGEVIVLEKC